MDNGFIVKAKLPSLNQYTAACRSNKYAGANFKRDVEEVVGWGIKQAITKGDLRMVNGACVIVMKWHEATKRRDCDNIQSSAKFILDALQKFKVIPNDSRKYVKQVYHQIIDDCQDYVEVNFYNVENVMLTIL